MISYSVGHRRKQRDASLMTFARVHTLSKIVRTTLYGQFFFVDCYQRLTRIMNLRASVHLPLFLWLRCRSATKTRMTTSQAVSLLVDLVEDLCLGAGHAGDVVPDILADAFDAFSDNPGLPADEAAAGSTAGSLGAVAAAPELPVFGRLSDTSLSSAAGLQSLFGGKEAMARFMSPSEGALVRK